MTLNDVIAQTRVHLKDTTQNVWTNADIVIFCNDAIRIIRKTVPLYFTALVPVAANAETVHIDSDYEYLIPLFCAARCFEQDEQHYRAVQKMNEFETRREEMMNEVLASDEYADLLAAQGDNDGDYVRDVYHGATTDDELS